MSGMIQQVGTNAWSVANIKPPWATDTHCANAWQVYDRYMTYSGGFPHVTSWGPQKGSTSITPAAGTIDIVSSSQYWSMNTAVADGDGIAASMSGNGTPFSMAFLFATVTTQAVGRFALCFGNSANTTSAPLGMVFNGTNSNFQFFRKNNAGTLISGGIITCSNSAWHLGEAHFDGTNLNSSLDTVAQDVNLAFEPGGTTTSNTFCLASYRGSGGRTTGSTARFGAIVHTGGSVWPAATQANVRAYLRRLQGVIN